MKKEKTRKNESEKGRMKISYLPLFTFLFSLFIFYGCNNSIDLPAGTGWFSLSLDDTGTERTIIPATVQNNFAMYTLEFFANGTTVNPVVTSDRTNATLSNPVLLNVGTWDLYVSAYMDTAKTKRAARGELKGITIGAGATTARSVTLNPIADGAADGTFSWTIDYPANVNNASMTITPLDANGTPELTRYFTGGTPQITKSSSLTLKTGYYRVVFKLANTIGRKTERRETLHVYQNMESTFAFTFTENQFTDSIRVTTGADSGAGSLRQAIADAPSGATIIIDRSVSTIALTSRLIISKTITIEGNGVTLTPADGWTESSSSQMLYLGTGGTATISRVWFKDGRATDNGAAIYNLSGDITLESCIFSGNRTSGYSSYGGAIYNGGSGTLSVKGCTFYGNSAGLGGAIFNGGTLTLTGNLFYGNTARAYSDTRGPVVYNDASATVTSNGYNAVDVTIGTANTESGWEADATDKLISSQPISPVSFRLFTGSQATNVIATLPVEYPTEDFYGDPIKNGAAAGAVQSTVSGNGYLIDLSVNDNAGGSVSVTPAPNTDGLYSGTVTIRATPTAGAGYYWAYWWKDNANAGSANPLVMTMTDHTKIQAVFGRIVPGTSLADKLAWLQTNAVSNGDYTIEVSANETINPTTLSYSGRTNIGVKLISTGTERIISLSDRGLMFSVTNGVTLTLDNNITLQGRKDYNSSNNSMVRVSTGGTLVMNTGSHITGNSADYGGVDLWGTFTMNGGKISDNISANGGVCVSNSGTFTMSGGEISGNTQGPFATGGGGVRIEDANFTMNGGKIANNTAGSFGGGVYMMSGTFTMNSGEISGNTVTNGNGGGVYIGSGSFLMNGGEISGNTGGGVYIGSGSFLMNGGKIANNITASTGGGVFIFIGTFTMNSGEISGNTVTNGSGGGVYIGYGSFRITNGTIYGSGETVNIRNTASSGASLYRSDGTAQYGTFSGNTWNNRGNLYTTNNTIRVINGVLQNN